MEPWNDPFSIWKTQAAFFSFLRGQLRRSWTHYPVSRRFKDSMCRPNTAGGRAKFVGNCHVCRNTLAKSHLQIDHIIPAGSIVDWETAGLFLKSLFTTSDNMRLVCKPCHSVITLSERTGLSHEETRIHQKVILFSKLSAKDQRAALTQLGLDFTGNLKQRKERYRIHLSS